MPKKFLLILFALLASPSLAFTANQHDVLINEVAWMGTTHSANDEWIELFNTTEHTIHLDGWVLKSDDETPGIKLTGNIRSNDYYLLERTDGL